MPFDDLQSFLSHLEARGDLKRVTVEVDPIYEISEIAQRAVQAGAPALALRERQGLALSAGDQCARHATRAFEARSGARPADFGDMLGGMVAPPDAAARPRRCVARAEQPAAGAEHAHVSTRAARSGRGVVEAPTSTPADSQAAGRSDGGRFVTLPLVMTEDPERGARNLGLYRMHVFDTTDHRHALADPEGRRVPPPRGREAGARPLPVTVTLGADPCLAPLRRGAAARGHRRAGVRRLPARRADAARARATFEAARAGATPSSCSRGSCPPASGAWRARSATTSATTRTPRRSRCSTSRRHAPPGRRLPRRRASASRRRRTSAMGEARRQDDVPARARHPPGGARRCGPSSRPASTTCSRSRSRSATRRRQRRPRSGCSAPGSCRSRSASCWSTRTSTSRDCRAGVRRDRASTSTRPRTSCSCPACRSTRSTSRRSR